MKRKTRNQLLEALEGCSEGLRSKKRNLQAVLEGFLEAQLISQQLQVWAGSLEGKPVLRLEEVWALSC